MDHAIDIHGLALQLRELSGSEDSAVAILDALLSLFASIDRQLRVGDVMNDWLDVRLDLRRLQTDGTDRPLEIPARI